VPDFVLIIHGRVYFLELKALKGKVSPAQRLWLCALGKRATVAYGYDDAKGQVRKWLASS
jgi:hypothetical protein